MISDRKESRAKAVLFVRLQRDEDDPAYWLNLERLECEDGSREWFERSTDDMGLMYFLHGGRDELQQELSAYEDGTLLRYEGELWGGWSGYECPEYDEFFDYALTVVDEEGK